MVCRGCQKRKERAMAALHQIWYYRKEWKSLRKQRLNANPLCQNCFKKGKVVPASVVDHINPHKGNWELFTNFDNTQSLCKRCHDGYKQQKEKIGFSRDIGEDGWPLDPEHPVYK